MRGSLVVASLLTVAALSGCFGADVHVEPQASSSSGSVPGSEPAAPRNEAPRARFELLNLTGEPSSRHFVGENVTADASGSFDRDGSIANYSWRMVRQGLFDADFDVRYGPVLTLTFDQPGDRTLVLQVRDDGGAIHSEYQSFSVHLHRVESGTLVAGQLPLGLGPVGPRNYSLPVVPGVMALSIVAQFPADPATTLRLEIRAPNGTKLNESQASEGPLWAIAAPAPGLYGNYTAHVSLVTGVAADFRLEFVAWYGYY